MASDPPVHRPTVPVTMPQCPVCGVELQLGSSGALDRWTCTAGHGLAMTLSESYERLQEDEIGHLWQLARDAAPGPLPSPFDGMPMRRFSLPFDPDEVPEGEQGDGADTGSVEIDVDVPNQFVWFDAGELEELPVDLPDAEPSPRELDKVAEIAALFGDGIEAAAHQRDAHDLSEQLYRRVARNPSAFTALDRVGRALTAY
jgi:Zn-finger nucleic acid-binding protein